MIIDQVVDVVDHLYHLGLEGWVGLKVCQGAHELFDRLLVQRKLSRIVSQGAEDFPILLHLHLSTENFQPDVMVLDLEVELIAFLLSVDDLGHRIALRLEQVCDKPIIEILLERLELLLFLFFTKICTRFVQLDVFAELLEKLQQIIL